MRELTLPTLNERLDFLIGFANKFKGECSRNPYGINLTVEGIERYFKSRYRREKGEVFISPYYFNFLGGDCDDQTISFIAYSDLFIKLGIVKPPIKILVLKQILNDGKSMLHITQKDAVRMWDFLPYELPSNMQIVKIIELPRNPLPM